jgi:hypothetical protein
MSLSAWRTGSRRARTSGFPPPPIARTSLFSFPTFEALLEGLADDFSTRSRR